MQVRPTMSQLELEKTLYQARQGQSIRPRDLRLLLNISAPEHIETLFQTARELRRTYFGNKIFLYGFLYIGTFCRNDCAFCFFRRTNDLPQRYRKPPEMIVDMALQLAESGVHLIDLTMGEDPNFHKNGQDTLPKLVARVQSATGLPVMISPGVIPDAMLKKLARSGASWYACYQETHNRILFNKLRGGQNYTTRYNKKELAHHQGLLIEEGILCGVGESNGDIATSFEAIRDLDADQVRVMNFVPQIGTPMEEWRPSDPLRELIIIAAMRLAFPHRLIPASLDVDGLDGLKDRLDAGANVVTSLVPPGRGLAGVAHETLDIENANRTVESVLPVLAECGLHAAHRDEYLKWVDARRKKYTTKTGDRKVTC